MGKLARSYANHFLDADNERCANLEDTERDWRGSPKGWTERMLNRDNGVLTTAARRWMSEHFSDEPPLLFFERRKVDLMVSLGSTNDLWATVPVLLVEHENAHDVEVEAWNLACWRVPLRVLVFYSDTPDQTDKFGRIEGVLHRVESVNPPSGEFLFLSAPWKFAGGLTWKAWEWRDRAIAQIETA